jgi:predicted nucleic acid-binding protein
LAGEVYIPKAVDVEMRYLYPTWRTQRLPWVKVEALVEPFTAESIAWQQAGLLDLGEAEAVALASQLQADWLLTDDAAARLVAQAQGLEVHGSLGVVLWAVAVGYFDRAESEATLDRLARSSLWVSSRVLAEARAALEQLYS